MKFAMQGKLRALALVANLCPFRFARFGAGMRDVQCECKSTPKEGQQALNRAVWCCCSSGRIYGVRSGLAFRYGKRRDREQLDQEQFDSRTGRN